MQGRLDGRTSRYPDGWGSYEGFDVFPEAIDWCQENITSKYPNFRFRAADIKNKEYNPAGRSAASEYELPYENSSFDSCSSPRSSRTCSRTMWRTTSRR